MKRAPVLWMVIPCYNEEAVLPITSELFLRQLDHLAEAGKIAPESRILLVDDGSRDGTWDYICQLARTHAAFLGIRQSRNRGHQNALLSGLMEARGHCDITISMDCDGQDDISATEDMVDAYLAGYHVVYGVRSNRDTDSLFKRTSAQTFYRLLNAMGVECVYNHADYRLLSAEVLDHLADYHEVNLFLRGLVPLVGYPSTTVSYRRSRRLAGESHYPLPKMLALAADGITSLSIKPIRFITLLGFLASLLSLIGIVWTLCAYFAGRTVAGWTSMTCIVCFMGGVQLLSIGIIGEYIGKLYLEAKARPRYIVSERTQGFPVERKDKR